MDGWMVRPLVLLAAAASTVLAELQRLLFGSSSNNNNNNNNNQHSRNGWLWSNDLCLRSMAQVALRALLRLPDFGPVLAKHAIAAAVAAMGADASGYVSE